MAARRRKKQQQPEIERQTEKANLEGLEWTIIAFCFGWPEQMHEVVGEITSSMFDDAMRRTVFELLSNIYQQDGPQAIETPALIDAAMASAGISEERRIEIMTAANDWLPGGPSAIRAVKDEFRRIVLQRNLREVSGRLNELAESTCEASELESLAQSAVTEALQKSTRVELKSIEEVMEAEIYRMEHGGVDMGYSTGLARLDELTNGLHDGDLVTVAARTSMGKSALVGHWIWSLAVLQELPGLVVSLEMPAVQYVQRLCSHHARVDLRYVRRRSLQDNLRDKYIRMAMRLKQAPIQFADGSGLTLGRVSSLVRRLYYESKLRWLVIDYIQIMDHGGRAGESRNDMISRTSGGLKNLAREMGIPIIMICQVNREPDKRKNTRPMLSDLRESGSLEQDSDIVIFIWRKSYYEKGENYSNQDDDVAELIVAKQRNGPVDTAFVKYLPWCAGFQDLTDEELANVGDREADSSRNRSFSGERDDKEVDLW